MQEIHYDENCLQKVTPLPTSRDSQGKKITVQFQVFMDRTRNRAVLTTKWTQGKEAKKFKLLGKTTNSKWRLVFETRR